MRKLLRAVAIAIALAFAVPAAPALAQRPQRTRPTRVTWTHIAFQSLPSKVANAQRRLFPHVRVTKVERAGAGKTATYRVTMLGKGKAAKFNAAGHLIK